MGAFDDLIPKGKGATSKKPGGVFGDLVPEKPKRGQRRSLVEEIIGAQETFNARIPLADEMAAGAKMVSGLVTGRHRLGEGYGLGDAFKTEMAEQRRAEADFEARRPNVAALTRGTGDAMLAAAPTGKLLQGVGQGSRMLNAGRGATTAGLTAATMAATDRGTAGERVESAREAATSPLVLGLGAGAAMLAPGTKTVRQEVREMLPDDMAARIPDPKPRTVPSRKADAAILKDLGVETSIPQRMGGIAKQTEDLAMRAPILGPAISGARGRQVEQLNRGWGLRALRSVGKTVPREVQPGFEMVEYVDDKLGEVYDDAARLVPRVTLDEQLVDDAARIGARRVDLADSEAAQFDRIVADRLNRLRGGEATGETVKEIHSELGKLQAEQMRKGNETLGSMIGETRRALLGLLERANPEAGEMIRKADEGWQIYSMMNDAAAKASNRGGVALPGQLNTEVRAAGRRLGSNMTGKGKAPMQAEATAAARMLPDQFGNPGTANAVGLGGLMVGGFTDPMTTATVAGGLSVAATPYWRMARTVIEELPQNASPAQLRAADQQLARLAASDPAVDALRREVAARLSVAAGVVAAPR